MRPCFQWKLRTRTLELGRRTLLMGIVNVTPDSFSDGGQFLSPEAAVDHALRLLGEGADIIDIGGESTRPGAQVFCGASSQGVTAAEELRRILPVISALRQQAPDALVSVDTYKAEVAREALAAGAEIVNDISGLRWDPAMAGVVASAGCGLVLMHTRGRPEEWRLLPRLGHAVVDLVCRELAESVNTAEKAGIGRENLVLDPGFGFGKSFEDNYPLLARLEEMQSLGLPILAGTSRKSFVGRTLSGTAEPLPSDQRMFGTLAAEAASILKGAHVIRTHDVAQARDAAAVCDAILQARSTRDEGN
jgi:dihydropteroate synthase